MTRRQNIKDKIPGDPISIRTKKSTPQYVLDGVNRARRANGNDGVLELIELGVQAKKLQENQGIFIPLPPGLTPDDIDRISKNDALLTLIGNIVKSSISLGNDIQFGVVANQVQTPVETITTNEGQKSEELKKTKGMPKKKKRVNLRGKGLTKMKYAFD